MNSIRIVSRPDVTPEQARDVRARAWAYVFACFERHKDVKKGGPATAPDDAMKGSK